MLPIIVRSLLLGQPVRSTLVARGLISAAVVVVLLSLACAGSNTPGPSNLTAEQMARLQDFAERVEREGYLRPALPAYVPPGLDPSPEIMDKGEESISFQFLPTPQESSDKTAAPMWLDISQQFDSLSLPLLCGNGSNLEDYDLADLDLECVQVGGRPADLQTTEQPDGTVAYDIGFELNDLDIHMSFSWKRGQDASRQTEEQMKQELLRVAASMTAP